MENTQLSADLAAELHSMIEVFSEPAVLIAPDYRIVAANRAYQREYAHGRTVGSRRCFEVSHHYTIPCDQAGETCPLKAAQLSGTPQRDLHLHHTPRGEEHIDVEIFPIADSDGAPALFLELMHYTKLASAKPQPSGLVGRSSAFNRALELVQRVAASEATVLLLGESGTGKELIAQAVHEGSARANGPFVPVECSGLTETLFESELFGHEKGAFTGAQYRKVGLVEAAQGGTLFLDEIGDVPLSLQVKLLRLLETGTYRRVGGIEPQRADFRLVCATHRNIKSMVDEGSFRMDLFYRINAFPIDLPALRERIEDLPLLGKGLLERLAPGRDIRLSAQALALLSHYAFPGNIRELRNILERATLLADGEEILPEHLPLEVRSAAEAGHVPGPTPSDIVPLEEMETRYLQWALARFHGEKRELAERLGVSERTLYRKLADIKQTRG